LYTFDHGQEEAESQQEKVSAPVKKSSTKKRRVNGQTQLTPRIEERSIQDENETE
jgi:hypothetical protein